MAQYPIQFPAQATSQESLRVAFQQAAMESPHTFAQQTINNADHWILEFNWPRMTHQEADAIQAWIDTLQGQFGTFLYAPRNGLRYDLSNRVLAEIAYAYGNTVSIGGWQANQTSGLVAGQYVQIESRLHRITAGPQTANAQGRCVVEVVPMIRKTLPVNTPVEFNKPKGTFRLATADGYSYTLDPDRKPSFPTIQAKEAL